MDDGSAGLTVACVLSASQSGPEIYSASHVQRLALQVGEHLKQPYKFVCVTDSPWHGWWAKISLWEPGRFTGRVLYLDLDVTILGSLDEIADSPAPFTIIRDWHTNNFNSSVMVWDTGNDYYERIFTLFNDIDDAVRVMEAFHGDQGWIYSQCPNAHTFPPGWVCSYRHQKRWNYIPADCKVLVYHGDPKPWDLPADHLDKLRG